MRRLIRSECPSVPGVYGFVDGGGRLIYVGVSRRLRKRLVTYFQRGELERKEWRIAGHAREVLWERVGHEFAAQLRELELIRRHEPRFNVKGREHNRALGYIYLSGDDAPRFRVGREVPRSARQAWGPLSTGWRIREAVEIVNNEFKLCDCSSSVGMHFLEQGLLFEDALRLGCLRGEVGTCLGPCAGLCSRRQYSEQVDAAIEFMDGASDAVFDRLAERMERAVARRQFEQAAMLRDRVERLQSLATGLFGLRTPTSLARAVYPLEIRGRRQWFLIVAGAVIGGLREPQSKREAIRGLGLLDAKFSCEAEKVIEGDRAGRRIVAGWFRKHAEDVGTLLTPESARCHCQRLLAG